MSKVQNQQDVRFIQNPFYRVFNVIKPESDMMYHLLLAIVEQFLNNVKLPTLLAFGSKKQNTQVQVSAYEGSSGYTYTLLRLSKFFKLKSSFKKEKSSNIYEGEDHLLMQYTDPDYYLNKAVEQYQMVTEHILKNKRKKSTFSFYMSQTCNWLCGMHIAYEIRNVPMFRQNELRLIQCYQLAKQSKNMMFQLLYGLPGFLYVILEAQKHYEDIEDQHFRTNLKNISVELTHMIIKEGIRAFEEANKTKINVQKLPENFRLVYTFHEKQYLGGAHGLGGNLNIILLSMKMNNFGEDAKIMYPLITFSIKYLLKHLVNGNFSTSSGSTNVKLVHFCHGCPGIIYCLARYTEMFPESAINLGLKEVITLNLEHIWKYGVLKKGFSLCHGISGNAYTFLSPTLHNVFPQKAQEFKKKALLFALLRQQKEVMKEISCYNFKDREVVGRSDYPYSLMIGICGDICFVIDAINGVGNFPGFDF